MIKKLLKEKDITITELAGRVGYTRVGMSLIVSGKRSCPVRIAKRIAKVLDVELDKIFKEVNSWWMVKR